MMTKPVARIDGLTVELPPGADRAYAVEDVSFELRAGEILCVVGESGSGKSISANALMGLLPELVRPVAGSIMLGDEDLLKKSPGELRALRGKRIAMIFQEPMTALSPLMRVADQIAEVFEAHDLLGKRERAARALDLLREVGIPDPELAARAYPFQLSGGQGRGCAAASAGNELTNPQG